MLRGRERTREGRAFPGERDLPNASCPVWCALFGLVVPVAVVRRPRRPRIRPPPTTTTIVPRPRRLRPGRHSLLLVDAAGCGHVRSRPVPQRRRQPLHRHHRRWRLHLRTRRRHRLVHRRPQVRVRRQPPRPGQRARGGMGQLLRPGLRGSGERRLRHPRRRWPHAIPFAERDAAAHRRQGSRDERESTSVGGPDPGHRRVGLHGPTTTSSRWSVLAPAARRRAQE